MMAILLVVLLTAVALPAQADELVFPSALTFEPGFAIGPQPGFPMSAFPSLGAPLTWVGKVSELGPPFDHLIPGNGHELTYALDGSTCGVVGNWDNQPCSGGEFGEFYGGTLTIYLDATPDADFTNISTFRDGDMVLIAETTVIAVLDDDPYEVCPMLPDQPDVNAYFRFVGGLWFDLVSSSNDGFAGVCLGELDNDVPADLETIGFVFRSDGVVDIYAPVSTTLTTWGAVKALYR